MGIAAGLVGKLSALFALSLALGLGAAHAQCADPFSIRPVANAGFTQTRHMSGVAQPLVSRGRASLQGENINWHITDPLDMLISIGPNGITQSIEGGPAQSVGPGGSGFLSGTGLSSVLRGDFAGARTHYDVVAGPAASDGDWTLRLTPRTAQLRQFVAAIEIAGCSAIDVVNVRQANGDRTEIQFSAMAP